MLLLQNMYDFCVPKWNYSKILMTEFYGKFLINKILIF